MPSLAQADSSVVVLGVRSLDGDDELARQVSQALREGARQVYTWKISERDVSLAQMSLAHGCEEPDARCMADIASTLEVDRLVYGTMVRNDLNVDITLFNFDAVTGQVESSINEKVPASALVEPALKSTASTLARRLGGIAITGALRVRGNAAGARVSVDGKDSGALDARGELLLAGLAVGAHRVTLQQAEVRAEQQVEVKEGETTTAQLTLALPAAAPLDSDGENSRDERAPSGDDSRVRRIVGYSAVGVAGALALATAYTWLRIDRINRDDDFSAYRNLYAEDDDACAKADARTMQAAMGELEASARSLCHEADTLEVLQYVFLGSAVAVGGIGAYLLLTKSPPSKAMSVVVQPKFGYGRGQVSATMRF